MEGVEGRLGGGTCGKGNRHQMVQESVYAVRYKLMLNGGES